MDCRRTFGGQNLKLTIEFQVNTTIFIEIIQFNVDIIFNVAFSVVSRQVITSLNNQRNRHDNPSGHCCKVAWTFQAPVRQPWRNLQNGGKHLPQNFSAASTSNNFSEIKRPSTAGLPARAAQILLEAVK
ncbi:MAG TPA: hypothetical protein VHY30_06675 [Verrucomicrobiae bacterium]|nr:hypothetical protein [Verrucomicrobiae bacterium]